MLRIDATRTAITWLALACSLLPSLARANANDCGVSVLVVGTAPASGGGLQVKFRVTSSKCDASSGRFGFTYRTSARPGVEVAQNGTAWQSVRGKSFDWTETIEAGSGVSIGDVKVDATSIQSRPG